MHNSSVMAALVDYSTASFPKPNSRSTALERTDINARNAAHQVAKAQTALWSAAPKSAIFKKKRQVRRDEDGTVIPFATRSDGTPINTVANRVLNTHTIRALASGAASVALSQLAADAKLMRLDVNEEVARYPVLPGVSSGAALLFESAISAYVAEALGIAMVMKNAIGKHQKVTRLCVSSAASILNRRIAQATSLMPSEIVVTEPTRVFKKRVARKAEAAAEEEE